MNLPILRVHLKKTSEDLSNDAYALCVYARARACVRVCVCVCVDVVVFFFNFLYKCVCCGYSLELHR